MKKEQAILILTERLKRSYRKLQDDMNNISWQLTNYDTHYHAIKALLKDAELAESDRKDIDRLMGIYTMQSLLGLDEQEYEILDRMKGFIDSYYEQGKYDGREMVGMFRSILKAGNFPPNYLIEFERRI